MMAIAGLRGVEDHFHERPLRMIDRPFDMLRRIELVAVSLEIGAGTKRLVASSGDRDHGNGRIVVGVNDGVHHSQIGGMVPRISPVRTVDRDQANFAVSAHQHIVVVAGHGEFALVMSRAPAIQHPSWSSVVVTARWPGQRRDEPGSSSEVPCACYQRMTLRIPVSGL
jgi:hypothetical protein